MFKKLLLTLGVVAMMAPAAQAQRQQTQLTDRDLMQNVQGRVGSEREIYDTKLYNEAIARTWSHTSYFNVGYIMGQSFKNKDTNVSVDTDWGAMVEIGNSFMVPHKPIGGFVKIGIDVNWIDISGAHFEKHPGDEDSYELTAGAGLGLSLHVAPCAKLTPALQPLRIEGYFRCIPSYAMTLAKVKDEVETIGGFMPQMAFGGGIDYKSIGIGFESRKGDATFKKDGEKFKNSTSSTRVYLSIRF